MEIGRRLRELRVAKGFSQGDIERLTGCLRCYTSRVENGHTVPKLETLQKYAKALDLELYQLFYVGKGNPKVSRVAATPAIGLEERALLKIFNRMTTRDRRMLLDVGRMMARMEK